ncbi:hypothetical protein Sste5346_008392 [Sporothrix stenoceras]|uniref:Histidine acid phosphatase n=1 Tax=Sporothrix stenoceras TaxID=5173 RepID=A0ABR3YPQ8_9PEZI
MAANSPLFKSLVLGLLAGTAAVPAVAAEDITVWSAVAFVMYGERTPLVGPTSPELTPLGAQQMYNQGTAFRERYVLLGTGNASIPADFPLYGIEANALDTTQVTAISTDDSYVAAGALAFMQGLYPPQTSEFAYNNGGRDAAVTANGAVINFPLDGYQYPLVTTTSLQDPASAWIEGNLGCSVYQQVAMNYTHSPTASEADSSTTGFYGSLNDTVWKGVFANQDINFYNAYHLYDYANYMYNHDSQVASALDPSDLDELRSLAGAQQVGLNGDLTVSGKTKGDMISAVAGRMMAQQVVNFMKNNVQNSGANNKLSLMFGSFEPMVAFAALAGLLQGSHDVRETFSDLPGGGGNMVFELYSKSASDSAVGNDTVYPAPNDLYVRFLYKPDTNADSDFTEYNLFGSGNSTGMPYNSFVSSMHSIGIDSVATWCDTCDAVSVFCPGMMEAAGYGGSSNSNNSNNNTTKKSGMAPAVAGVIGAVVTLAVVGLAVLLAMLLGGLRFFFGGRRASNAGSNNNGANKAGIFAKRFSFGNNGNFSGGFRGSNGERKSADADVAVSGNGVGHERMGSWELRNGSNAGAAAATSAGEPSPRTERVHSTIVNRDPEEDDEDIMADIGRNPMDPREHV